MTNGQGQSENAMTEVDFAEWFKKAAYAYAKAVEVPIHISVTEVCGHIRRDNFLLVQLGEHKFRVVIDPAK